MRSLTPTRWQLQLVDALGATALFVVMVLEPVIGRPRGVVPAGSVTATGVALSAVICLALAFRRRWPVPVLAVVTGLSALSLPPDGGPSPTVLATVVAVYTVAANSARPLALTAGAATAVVLVVASIVAYGSGLLAPQTVVLAAWAMLATAVGDAVRSRRAYVAAVEERARRAEQSREQEARSRVAEDRLRIARDLHDVLAHHIAVINVQAGVAGYVLRTDPDAAEQALATVRGSSRSVLDELGTILSVLRHGDDDPDAPTEPTPGLARSTELVDAARAAGLTVTWRTTGQPTPLAPATDLAAYRLLQEALTNAHKHGGGGPVVVDLRYADDRVRIEVANPLSAAGPAGPGTGYGLAGMRERVTAVGGSVQAGPDSAGHYRVRAELPAGKERT